MKALDWYRFMELEREKHGKTLFRISELANVAGREPHALNVELGRLLKARVIARYATGIYGMPGAGTPEQLVRELDPGAYITGMYALHSHNMITQVPVEITCFTNRRHNRSRQRMTPFGRVIFVCVSSGIYRMPEKGVVASPEQAFCDYIHMLQRRGLDPAGLVTFRNLRGISKERLSATLIRYPASVRKVSARFTDGHLVFR